ncbi:TolC family protein [Sphingomonas spermidinifaciens]|uniref:TolC family protein n=1 Tax=Sphingomonas spermidinifaciens TaxID=1141889 RepID=UPI001FE726B8|nr:TolC family protein [Sphingomonas spermidinifaciens]
MPPRLTLFLIVGAELATGSAAAGQVALPPAGGSPLVVNPQGGATPTAPAPRTLPPPPTIAQPVVVPSAPATSRTPPITLQPVRGDVAEPQPRFQEGARARGDVLPAPSADPLRLDPRADPILAIARDAGDRVAFDRAIQAAVDRHPAVEEAEARRDEARASRNEARTLELPVVDMSMSYFNVLTRQFSNDPQNVLERSRPRERTDQILRVQWPVFDFGTAKARIGAGNQRLRAATAGIDDVSTRLALQGVQAWYQVYGYRALVRLSEAFLANQTDLRAAIDDRIRQGVSAPGDKAQVESYIAAAQTQLAGFRRNLAQAEAQFQQVTGSPAPAALGRAPTAENTNISRERAEADSANTPPVVAARRQAEAARYDLKAAKADALPGVALGVDTGRYGVFENAGDYDVRGSVTVTHRILGGADQRIDQYAARARGAEAALERTKLEAARDAAVAWSDLGALRDSASAIEANYLATRQSRDVLVERFRVARGTLFDVLSAETNYFNVATRYIETVTELDIARYTLLARTGRLLETFGIAPATTDTK